MKAMKLKAWTITICTTVGLVTPASAENLEHINRLLSSKECQRCELSNAGLTMSNLAGAKLTGANLAGANLSRSNLAGADLRDANLTGASLYGANLTGANLMGANLNSTDLREAYLFNANLAEATLTNAYLLGAIGLSSNFGDAEDYYRWAMDSGRKKNYQGAIENFSQAISRKPDFAPAFIGRSVARLSLGEKSAAIADAKIASKLFLEQGNMVEHQAAEQFITDVQTPPKKPRRSFGDSVINVLGGLLQIFLQ